MTILRELPPTNPLDLSDLSSEQLTTLTQLNQGQLHQIHMESPQVQAVNALPPTLGSPCNFQALANLQETPLFVQDSQEDPKLGVPPTYFLVSHQYLSHQLPHGFHSGVINTPFHDPPYTPLYPDLPQRNLSSPNMVKPPLLIEKRPLPLDMFQRLKANHILRFQSDLPENRNKTFQVLSLCEILTPLLGEMGCIKHFSTLISAILPSLCVWNQSSLPLISSMNLETNDLDCISDTNCCYHQLEDALVFENTDFTPTIYQDHSHIAPEEEYLPSPHFPYGWSAAAEDYCLDNKCHPDCLHPQGRSIVETNFVEDSLADPEGQGVLDDHISIIHNNSSGKQLQWLLSSTTPIIDDVNQRASLTSLYAKVHKQGGNIYHSKKGLRITVPEEKWINWTNLSSDSQDEFTQVAWAQMTQFDKEAMMFALSKGKLGNNPIYINFVDSAEHNNY